MCMIALRQCQTRRKRFVSTSHILSRFATNIDQTPPKKVAKPRRKRGEPLAEISANVPRGNSRRITRSNLGQGKSSKPHMGYNRTSSSDITPIGQFKRSHDIFRDDDTITGMHACAYRNSFTDMTQDSMTIGRCQVLLTGSRGIISLETLLRRLNSC